MGVGSSAADSSAGVRTSEILLLKSSQACAQSLLFCAIDRTNSFGLPTADSMGSTSFWTDSVRLAHGR